MTLIEQAQHYFTLSNASDYSQIELMFSERATYRSGSGEWFLGIVDIMTMQRNYHESFVSLKWQVNAVKEIKPGIIVLDFLFKGQSKDGSVIAYSGIEHIIFYHEKIQHIDVKRTA